MSECPFHRLLDFDSFTDGTPRALIAELRRSQPVYWEEDDYGTGGHWTVLRGDDIDRVLKTPELFSNRLGPLLEDMPPEVLAEQQQSLTFMDPPEHRQYRQIVDYAFRPKATAAREPAMRAQAKAIIDAVIDRGECEFVNEVALQLPMRVMFTLLGVRERDYRRVVGLTNTLTLADDPDFAADRADGFMASMQLMDYGTELAADHRAEPRETMTMEVLESTIDGRQLSDREFGRFFNNLIVGGVETTRNTLAFAIYELIRHPEQYDMLKADPTLVADAIEEVLRHRNTVVYLRRTATADTELGGQRIRAGDKVVCILGGPNRDEAHFADPDTFDITRPRREQVRRHYRTFGAGPHFCIGVHQARMNLTVMLDEIVARMDNFRLLAEPKLARSIFMDGFKEMRVAFDRR